MPNRKYMVTGALPYSNGRIHVGHIAGAYLPADIYVRFLRARGEDVRFVCGTDDHGVTPLISARKEGMPVEELVSKYHARQAADFQGLGIEFDFYAGTHHPDFYETHARFSQEFFKSIHDRGHLVKRTTTQLYDVEAKQFLPDRYVKGTCYHKKSDGSSCGYTEAYGDQCESCGNAIDAMKLIDPVSTITGTRPEPRDTTHWHMTLGAFEEPLREWLQSKRDAEPPWRDGVLNFALGQIKQGLPERAMTRDLTWGIPVPLEDPDAEGKVLYVWFDAPIGYVSFTAKWCQDNLGDWRRYADYWKNPDCRIVHFIGEDNIIFHALTWPAMIMAEGSYQLPWYVPANSFLNIKMPGQEEQKISKSRGMAIWVEEYLKQFDPDPLRYYLTAIAPENHRTVFDVDDFIVRNNSELLNALGNFINRALAFNAKYFGGVVPPAGERDEKDRAHLALLSEHFDKTTERLEALQFKAALGEVMALARASNVYFDAKEPWRTRKEDEPACKAALNVCIQTIKALTVMMGPFLPHSAKKAIGLLGFENSEQAIAFGLLKWDEALKELPEGHVLGTPEVLFKKLDSAILFGEAGV